MNRSDQPRQGESCEEGQGLMPSLRQAEVLELSQHGLGPIRFLFNRDQSGSRGVHPCPSIAAKLELTAMLVTLHGWIMDPPLKSNKNYELFPPMNMGIRCPSLPEQLQKSSTDWGA